jgi:hypothetical protein
MSRMTMVRTTVGVDVLDPNLGEDGGERRERG